MEMCGMMVVVRADMRKLNIDACDAGFVGWAASAHPTLLKSCAYVPHTPQPRRATLAWRAAKPDKIFEPFATAGHSPAYLCFSNQADISTLVCFSIVLTNPNGKQLPEINSDVG